jgi:hypothetical protein
MTKRELIDYLKDVPDGTPTYTYTPTGGWTPTESATIFEPEDTGLPFDVVLVQ